MDYICTFVLPSFQSVNANCASHACVLVICLVAKIFLSVIILNTISKRQDGLGFIGKNGYIFHDSSRCIEVPIGGTYAHMFEDLLQVISYNIPLFSLIQMLKFVLHILNLK